MELKLILKWRSPFNKHASGAVGKTIWLVHGNCGWENFPDRLELLEQLVAGSLPENPRLCDEPEVGRAAIAADPLN